MALRAKLLEEIRGDESLADQFRSLLLRVMDKRHITEADPWLARADAASRISCRSSTAGRD
jgi:hypothetical protein